MKASMLLGIATVVVLVGMVAGCGAVQVPPVDVDVNVTNKKATEGGTYQECEASDGGVCVGTVQGDLNIDNRRGGNRK
ncbi:MAG: hypothetical protein FWD57_07340 [Polyangiaceae bacterium]|nr:hypothetical protein [Polyangiaceae bacterium]